jgi:hypothetical protein
MMLFEAQHGGELNTVNPPETRQLTLVGGHGPHERRRGGHPICARGYLREFNGKSNQVHGGVIDPPFRPCESKQYFAAKDKPRRAAL